MCFFSLCVFVDFLIQGIFWHRSTLLIPLKGQKKSATQPLAQTFQQEVLHNELLETWDERGLPLENFNVALPAICGAQGCLVDWRSGIFVAGGSWLRRRFSKISGWWCSSEKIDGSCFEPFVLFGLPKGTTLQLSMFWTFLKYSNEVKSTTI